MYCTPKKSIATWYNWKNWIAFSFFLEYVRITLSRPERVCADIDVAEELRSMCESCLILRHLLAFVCWFRKLQPEGQQLTLGFLGYDALFAATQFCYSAMTVALGEMNGWRIKSR
jgi:hypothetical protein